VAVPHRAEANRHIHFQLRRAPRSLKGRLLAALLSLVGAGVFCADLESTLAQLRAAPQPVQASV
jgi:hypothetical protein